MDNLLELETVTWDMKDLHRFFVSEPELLRKQHKRSIELLCTYLLCLCWDRSYVRDIRIGFALQPDRRAAVKITDIASVLGSEGFTVDDDFDTFIATNHTLAIARDFESHSFSRAEVSELFYYKIQVTRCVTLAGNELQRLISKKCAVSHDDHLGLLLFIDDDGEIDTLYLHDILSVNQVPFGKVWLVGISAEPSMQVFAHEIYDKPSGLGYIDLPNDLNSTFRWLFD